MNIDDLRATFNQIDNHCKDLFAGKHGEITRQQRDCVSVIQDNAQRYIVYCEPGDLWEDVLQVHPSERTRVSNELRTPLTPMLGYTKLLLEGIVGDLNEEQYRVIKSMYELIENVRNQVELFMQGD